VFGSKRGFTRSRGRLTLRLDDAEVTVLRGLLKQFEELVAPTTAATTDPLAAMVGIDVDSVTPQDPALLRLFPDGYRDDPDAAADFRRFTERGLRNAKLERATVVGAVLEQFPFDESASDQTVNAVVVDGDQSQAWLLTCNDLRLVLGSRLEIVSDDQQVGTDWDSDDDRFQLLSLYQWLTWLQSTLLESLARR